MNFRSVKAGQAESEVDRKNGILIKSAGKSQAQILAYRAVNRCIPGKAILVGLLNSLHMRILRVAQEMYPDVLGGGAYHTHALSRDQAQQGHDVRVVSISNARKKPEIERFNGYTLRRYRPIASPFGMDISLSLGRELRQTTEYDIIHAHSHVYYATNLAAVVGSVTDTPLAITCHGLHSHSIPHWLSRVHLRSVGKLTYDQADVVFCYTQAERSKLRDIGVEADVEVVSNGIDVTQFSPDGPEYEEIADTDGPAILFVGRLASGKRPEDAIAVVDRLRSTFPDVRLFICGDGPRRADLETKINELGLQENVRFLGTISYDTIPSVYRAADAFMLPSLAEGFPRTVLESLACETPTVATALDQTESLLKQAGYAVPRGDVEQFASGLRALLTDTSERRRLGRRGREIVEREYDWSDTVERTTARLESLSDNDS